MQHGPPVPVKKNHGENIKCYVARTHEPSWGGTKSVFGSKRDPGFGVRASGKFHTDKEPQ